MSSDLSQSNGYKNTIVLPIVGRGKHAINQLGKCSEVFQFIFKDCVASQYALR